MRRIGAAQQTSAEQMAAHTWGLVRRYRRDVLTTAAVRCCSRASRIPASSIRTWRPGFYRSLSRRCPGGH